MSNPKSCGKSLKQQTRQRLAGSRALTEGVVVAFVLATAILSPACDVEDSATKQPGSIDNRAALGLVEAREISNSPSYFGVNQEGSLCDGEFHTIGWEPKTDGRFPLFVYLPGTAENHAGAAAKTVLQAMARRGFVAVSADYDRYGPGAIDAFLCFLARAKCEVSASQLLTLQRTLEHKAACLFDPNRKNSLVGEFCARPNVDCSRGIALWGYSQGGGLAMQAAAYDARVRAVWSTGVGGGIWPWTLTTMTPHDRLRIINGSTDGHHPPKWGDPADTNTLNAITGMSCEESPCLVGPNGSGWYLVQPEELEENGDTGHAGHCWFNQMNDISNTCTSWWKAPGNLDPNWLPAEVGVGGAPFSVDVNGQWLKDTLQLGEIGSRDIEIGFSGFEFGSKLTPIQLVDVTYPMGVIDWKAGANFSVCGPTTTVAPCAPVPAVSQSYAVIGSGSLSAQTGSFTFVAPKGWELQSMTVYNSSPSATSVTTQVLRADGTHDSQTDALEGRSRSTLRFAFGGNVRTVAITIGNGVQTKIEKLLVNGSAPTHEPRGTCPATHIALQAYNGRYVSSNAADPDGPLQAIALRPLASETFTCVELDDGKVALARGDVFVQSNGTNPKENSLNVRWEGPTTPGETEEFTYIDLGEGAVTLRASNGAFVSADLLLPGAQLVADRSTSKEWERFKVVPMP
ncbi:MAG: hypothetical protein MUC50_08355 [Myxococcota bacterium]|jgi:acetyl esterase/lipase|nr:hypothetical protein [Myxococcota bacterium]